MRGLNEKIEHSLLKIFVAIVGLILLLGAGGYFSLRALHSWQTRRLLADANACINTGDYKGASFDAQRALQLDPINADATRVIAQSAERAGLRNAVDLWRRVVELTGNSDADLAAWARCAVRFGDVASANKALDAISQKSVDKADYHALRADVALMQHDLATYERELLEAARLDPQNGKYRLALATLHVAASDLTVHENGVRELLDLRNDEPLRRDATHRLADDALRRGEIDRALGYARELDGFPNRDFSDRLLLLSALKAADDVEMQTLLAQLKKEADDDATKIGALIVWMNREGMSADAVAWVKNMPASRLTQRTLPLAAAEAFMAVSDWEGLRKFLSATKWEPGLDYMRNAFMARALRELGRTEESTQRWNTVVDKINGRSEQIFLLADLTKKWGWQKETLDLWWLAAKDPKNAEKTLRMLYEFYAVKRDTPELYRVLLHLVELRPNDRAVINNFAQISLLLKLDVDRANRLAREVHEQEPKNPDYASTYAFSLYVRGETTKALQIFAALSAEELKRPQIAAYYGMVLAGTNDFSQAAKFLDLGAKANLLPEEQALVERAQLALAGR